jgi:hypothetical protein
MFQMQVSRRRLLIVAPICIASITAACASEEAGPSVELTATESIKSSESSQTDEYCILEFPESSIDETVRIGDMTFFLVNAAYRDKPMIDVCQHVPVPDISNPPSPWVLINVEMSRLADSLLFTFDVPTWAPDGFRFSGDALLIQQELDRYEAAVEQGKSPGFAFSTKWENPSGDRIGLTIYFRGGAIRQRVISGSLDAPDLEVGSAALIRGTWTEAEDSIAWSDELLTLIVDVGGNLRYQFGTTGDSVTAEDLIRMAESMKPIP